MEIKFTSTELIYLYGHFTNELNKLESLKDSSNFSVDTKADISLCKSILKKLSDSEPKLLKLDSLINK